MYSMVTIVNNTVLHIGKSLRRENHKSPHYKKKNFFVTVYGDGY